MVTGYNLTGAVKRLEKLPVKLAEYVILKNN